MVRATENCNVVRYKAENIHNVTYLISISAYFSHTVMLRWSISSDRSYTDLALHNTSKGNSVQKSFPAKNKYISKHITQ